MVGSGQGCLAEFRHRSAVAGADPLAGRGQRRLLVAVGVGCGCDFSIVDERVGTDFHPAAVQQVHAATGRRIKGAPGRPGQADRFRERRHPGDGRQQAIQALERLFHRPGQGAEDRVVRHARGAVKRGRTGGRAGARDRALQAEACAEDDRLVVRHYADRFLGAESVGGAGLVRRDVRVRPRNSPGVPAVRAAGRNGDVLALTAVEPLVAQVRISGGRLRCGGRRRERIDDHRASKA